MSIQNPIFQDNEAIAQATKDIHERCQAEVNLLWDEGKSHPAGTTHKLKIWNGLGSLHYQVEHRDLVERDTAYRLFLDDLTWAVNARLTLRA